MVQSEKSLGSHLYWRKNLDMKSQWRLFFQCRQKNTGVLLSVCYAQCTFLHCGHLEGSQRLRGYIASHEGAPHHRAHWISLKAVKDDKKNHTQGRWICFQGWLWFHSQYNTLLPCPHCMIAANWNTNNTCHPTEPVYLSIALPLSKCIYFSLLPESWKVIEENIEVKCTFRHSVDSISTIEYYLKYF